MIRKKTLGTLALFTALLLAVPSTGNAAVANWQQKGITIWPRWNTDFSSDTFRQSVDRARLAGANTIGLVIPYFQSSGTSSDLQPAWNTPTDDSLASAVSYIHSKSMAVMFKPQLEAGGVYWRAFINASDRSAWFAAYQDMLLHYGRIAEAQGVEHYCIGSELIDMASDHVNSSNSQAWVQMINAVRGVYSGKLTYSGNRGYDDFTNEYLHIGFWPQLDYIGISAYFELSKDPSDPVGSLMRSWTPYEQNFVTPLQNRIGKPVVFTEVGYRSVPGASTRPWDYNLGGPYDPKEQADDYEALFRYWNNLGYMNGIQLWNWESDPSAGGPGNTNYTPQGKDAEQVMRTWFSGGGTTTPTQASAFSAQASVIPASPAIGQSADAAVTFQSSQSAANLTLDMEIYSQSGSRVAQKFMENQSLAAGVPQTFHLSFTPQSAETYTVKAGVFNSSWSANYFWGDNLVSFTAGGQTPPQPPPAQASCPPPASGTFTACLYDNPDFTNLKVVRSDAQINFDWGSGSPDPAIGPDTFSAVWAGNFDFQAGSYTFTATADDGVRVYIDGNPIISAWNDQPATTYAKTVDLTAGTHTVKMEYYENGGGAVAKLAWNNAGNVQPPPSQPPQAGGNIEIWWPTNGSTVSGLQPFKAMAQNMLVSGYSMYWQVDSGVLNPMYNSSQGYPHKEALVDVSGWNWNGAGTYLVNFVAQSLGGQPIGQKSATINISR